MVRIHRGKESDLETAVGLVGPVTVGIDSKHYSFQVYYISVTRVSFDWLYRDYTHTLIACYKAATGGDGLNNFENSSFASKLSPCTQVFASK